MRTSRFLPCAAAILLLLVSARRARAEPDEGGEASVDFRAGQAKQVPYFTQASPTATGYGGSLFVSASFPVARKWRLAVRAPLALMRVEQPAGALYAEAAWGNPELAASVSIPLRELEGSRLLLTSSLAIGVPLAEHDRAQLAGRALVLANALEGFSEPALFTPGVLPFTPSASLRWQSPRWLLAASLRLPVLFRFSDADLPAESETHSVGFTPVTTLEARLRVLSWLSLAATPRLTIRAVPPVEDAGGVAQLLAAGTVDFHITERLSIAVVAQAPLAGPLGGSTAGGGIGVRGQL